MICCTNYPSDIWGKRRYFSETMTREFTKRLNASFGTRVDIPRIMRGEEQEFETLISEEALLFAKYLRNERKDWNPRTVSCSHRNAITS